MKFKSALKKFAYETFRPRSKEEYAEIFARGNGGEGQRSYPWLYARIFLFSLLLFSLLCLGYSLSKINFIAVAFLGGIFADVTFIVLLFELYPKRDLSLMTPVLTLVIGGLAASIISYVMYGVALYSTPFAEQAWTAFVEETSKALVTVIILLVLKKRNPFHCLIIGAAVGGGYSAFENMWYMYTNGFMWWGLSEAMQTGLWRAIGTPFSHAAWAGAFGWAIADERPWRSWKPYAVYAFNFTMHFFVNFPLMSQFAGWKGYPISALTGIFTIIFIIYLIVTSRRSLIVTGADGVLSTTGTYPQINALDSAYIGGNDKFGRYEFITNVLAAAAIFCLSFAFFGPTCVYGGRVNYKEYYYSDLQTCIYIAQNNLTFSPDYDREYVEYEDLSENYSYTWTDGELTSVTQREQYGEYFYKFTYGQVIYHGLEFDEDGVCHIYVNGKDTVVKVEPDEDGNFPDSVKVLELFTVSLEYDERTFNRSTAWEYPNSGSADGRRVYYFSINPNVYTIYYDKDVKGGPYVILMRENVEIRLVESIVFFSVFGAATLGCGIAYIICKLKLRRNKNYG